MSNRITRAVCIAVISLHVAGCTTVSTMQYTPQMVETNPVREGDTVKLTTNDHRILRFVVASVTPERVCSADQCVRSETIETVERTEFSAIKTVFFVLGLAFLAAAIGSLATSPLSGGLSISGGL